jgi:hypothetical protein
MNMPDEIDQPEDLFPLIGDVERPAVQEIIKGVRILFCRKDITAQQLHYLAVLLFGLQALPNATPGLNATLSLSYQFGENMTYQSVNLTDSTFELMTGGSEYTPGAGHDSFSQTPLMIETGGFRDVDESALVEWIVGFKERTLDAEIRVDLDESCDIDWTAEPDDTAWTRAIQRSAEDESDDQ